MRGLGHLSEITYNEGCTGKAFEKSYASRAQRDGRVTELSQMEPINVALLGNRVCLLMPFSGGKSSFFIFLVCNLIC